MVAQRVEQWVVWMAVDLVGQMVASKVVQKAVQKECQ
jgi:nicotinamide riboside transporter PnuC